MTHIAYTEKGPAIEHEYDYVVVGSGAGGASVAFELAQGGAKVAVVEAGAWREPKDYPSSIFGAFRDVFDNFGQTLARGRAIWPVIQGRAVGGTTVINSAIIVRTPGDIFQNWEKEHGFGGEAMAKSVWHYQDEIEKELSVAVTPDNILGRSSTHANAADKKLSMGGNITLRGVKNCRGSGQCLQGCRNGSKQSLNLTYIPEVERCGGIIFSCANVQRVLLKGNKALGVEGHFQHPQTSRHGAKFRITAQKAVVLAASATHTPAILMRSGIKNKAIGNYFRAHPGTNMIGCYPDPVNMGFGATQGWASTKHRINPGIKLETLSLPLEILGGRVPGVGQDLTKNLLEFPYLASWIAIVNGNSFGQVKAGLFGMGPNISYSMTTADIERLRAGAVMLAKMHFEAGAKYVITGVHSLPGKLKKDQLHLLENAPADQRCWTGVLTHLFGGAVMGTNINKSVCDGNGKVRDYENLYVADASAFPSTLGINPQHTIMAIGRLRGRQLLEQQ